ncbi:MAG: MATE family efflux transporter [Clostridia bacterium]|nr:MATE family efflux transporter [Clostridia bacterium]
MKIQLSEHFTYKKLLIFTFPSIMMMIFTSIYGVVDGYFVSNYAGETPFAAVNFIMPFLMILGTVGFMFGTGGSALVSKTLGEGDSERANSIFSLLVYASIALGILIEVVGFLVLEPVARLLGAEGEMLKDCVIYGRIILLAVPAFVLQMEFQNFFVTAEKPTLGLIATVAAGVTNMILDALFVAFFRWELVGAAAATALSQAVGGIFPLVYFARKNQSLLRLGRTKFDGRILFKTCTNGSSELMTNISLSLVNILYNFQLLKYAGEGGISAYGVIMYVCLFFLAVFIGYSIGTAPVISFHFGAGNTLELKSILKKSFVVLGISSVLMLLLGEVLAVPLSRLFVGYSKDLFNMTRGGFRIYSFSFLFAGIAIFGSSFFTALNDGLTSALISFLRTLLYQVVAVMLLPVFWGIDGIWYSTVVSESLAVITALVFIIKKRKKYGY